MPAPAIGAILARVLASTVARAAASRAAAGTAARAAGGKAAQGGVGEMLGGMFKNVAGQSTRIDLAQKFGPQPAGIAESFGPLPAPPRAAPVPPPTFSQRASSAFKELAFGRDPPQKFAPKPQMSDVATRGKNFGDMLSGKLDPGAAQQRAHQHDQEQAKADERTEAVAGFGKSLLGDFAKTLSGPTGAVAGIVGLAVATKKLADGLYEANKSLKAYNGQIAVAYARAEMRERMRMRESGANTSATSSALVDAVQDYRDQAQPVKDLATNLGNVISIGFYRILGGLAASANYLLDLKKWAASFAGQHQRGPVQQWINDFAAQHREFEEKKREQRKKPAGSGGKK